MSSIAGAKTTTDGILSKHRATRMTMRPKGSFTQEIGVVVVPGLQLMSIAALAVFQATNVLKESKVYDVSLLSENGGNVLTVANFPVGTEPLSDALFDTVIVAGFMGTAGASGPIIDFVHAASRSARRIGSFCTGAFILAQAQLLSGRRATTHWRHARELQARFPDIRIETDSLFVNDGSIWTSAGMMAGLDMALALVEADHGVEVARTVARRMVLERRRSGGQPQVSSLLDLEPETGRVRRAVDHIRKDLRGDLSVARLAGAASMSPRQLSRAFVSELGETPAKVVERLRAEAARALLTENGLSGETIAEKVGFNDRERMRRAFLRLYGRPPQAFRTRNGRAIEAGAQHVS